MSTTSTDVRFGTVVQTYGSTVTVYSPPMIAWDNA
jgi:hypothetical protein